MYFCDMKVLYILFGTLSLALGIIGIFLPLLPTTPFLLLTAALYVRSSPRLYNRLLHHKYLGSHPAKSQNHLGLADMDNHPQLYLFHSPLLVAKGSVVADCSRNKLPHPLFQNTEIDSKNAPSPLRASASLSSQCFTEFCPIMSVTYFTAMNGVFLVRHTHAWA